MASVTSTPPSVTDYDGKKKCTRARIDIAKVNQVNDVNLGDTIELVIKGRVKSLDGPEERLEQRYNYKNGKETGPTEVKVVHPGTIEIEIESMAIGSVGEFDGIWKDED